MEESGREMARGGRGQETLRDHSRVGTEVVVRNDNTSTDISIIYPRYTLCAQHSILQYYLATHFFKNRL